MIYVNAYKAVIETETPLQRKSGNWKSVIKKSIHRKWKMNKTQ